MLKVSSFFMERLAIFLSILVSIGFLSWILWSGYYGFDFTDEGYYLNWISHPWLYDTSTTQFGYLLNPVYELLGRDVARIRQFNFIIIYASTFIIVYLLLNYSQDHLSTGRPWRILDKASISMVFASGAFIYFQNIWIATPSYNSLAFVSVCITAASFILIYRSVSTSYIGWVLLAVGGWLAFMTKPTTAAALFVIALIFIIVTQSWRIRGVLLSGIALAVLLIGSVLYIDGSLYEFYTRLDRGAEWARILVGGNTLLTVLRIDDFSLTSGQAVLFWFLGFCGCSISLLNYSNYRYSIWINGLLVAGMVTMSACYLVFWESVQFPRLHFQVIPLTGFPVGMVLAGLTMVWKKKAGLNLGGIPLFLSFILFPCAFTFGTNNNYWLWATSAGVFWLLSGLVFQIYVVEKKISFWMMIILASFIQLSTIIFVNSAMRHPYRQPQPLWLNQDMVVIGTGKSELVLERETGIYVSRLREVAKLAGFKPGTPVIDLTGHYPGALFVLGAKPIGSPWLIGGYSGSDNWAFVALARVRCKEIASAWILDEPEGPRRFSAKLFPMLGIDLAQDYKTVARILGPPGQYPERYFQVLLKPTRAMDIAIVSCKKAKTKF